MQIIENLSNQAIQIVYDQRLKYPDADNLAVVFDIDGTLLNEDTPILPVIHLYNTCKSLGYNLFIVTARDSHGINETVDQLNSMHITDYTSMYFRVPTYWDMYKYKETSRESIENKGYHIVLSIGDSEWDIGKFGGYGVLLPAVQHN
jgi:phosphoglycolate phosphatase-like HAD superfamily hydrolase